MLSASDSQPQGRGFESRQKPVGSSKPSRVGCGWRQWCLGSLSRKWVPGYRQRWQLYLDYPWRLEACKRVYTPQGIEQVTDITGLPGIICKALWASFGKKKCYKNCILLLFMTFEYDEPLNWPSYYYYQSSSGSILFSNCVQEYIDKHSSLIHISITQFESVAKASSCGCALIIWENALIIGANYTLLMKARRWYHVNKHIYDYFPHTVIFNDTEI